MTTYAHMSTLSSDARREMGIRAGARLYRDGAAAERVEITQDLGFQLDN